MKHFLKLLDFTPAEIAQLLDTAAEQGQERLELLMETISMSGITICWTGLPTRTTCSPI